MKKIIFFTCLLGLSFYALGQSPYLIKDINTSIRNGIANFSSSIAINNILYFDQQNYYGNEIWRTDGTATGTYMLKDIADGKLSSNPNQFTNVNGTLFFIANDGTNGTELWKSDGTVNGTSMVKDINSGSSSSFPSQLTNVNGTLFFTSNDGINGTELWKSDGTSAGTFLVKSFSAGATSTSFYNFCNVNSMLFFSLGGTQIWKSDGTASGTVLVKNINATSDDCSNFFNSNGMLYFTAKNSTSNTQLWKTDGSDVGTVLIRVVKPSSTIFNITSLVYLNSYVYFKVTDGFNNQEFWKSDGTNAGTTMLTAFTKTDNIPSYSYLKIINNTIYFNGFDNANGEELWKSDGNTSGTILVKNINSGNAGSYPQNFCDLNGTLYFQAINSTSGVELWKSDGTVAGTIIVKDIFIGTNSSNPKNLSNVNGTLFFTATNKASSTEIYKSDGTAVDALSNTYGVYNSSVSNLVSVSSTVYFTADDGIKGEELWKSDGTSIGTIIVKDINTGSVNSDLQFLTNVNGTLFFSANDGTNGKELWKSDGTIAGTVLVKDIISGLGNSNPFNLINANGILYFWAYNSSSSIDLWKSDGSTIGTVLIKNFAGNTPLDFTTINNILYFSISSATNGVELWKSDGTTSGTFLVKDINSGVFSSNPSYLTNVNGTLFFSANDGTNGNELWKSDGSAAGTFLVKDLIIGSSSSFPINLINVNNILYFALSNSSDLYKSDGTAAGTALVKNISLANTTALSQLKNVNNTLFFVAKKGSGNEELWKSDGTSANTVLVKMINSPTNLNGFENLTNVNGVLYFSFNDGNSGGTGKELWKSDGTTSGTVLVTDIYQGIPSSTPILLTDANGKLFFCVTNAKFNFKFISNGLFSLKNCDLTTFISNQSDALYFNENQVSATQSCYCDNNNNLIASLISDGTNPVNGQVNTNSWIETIQSNFVKRHYELTPINNASSATAKVILYFTQQDFNDFNNQSPAPASLLPISSTDVLGKANLKIEKRSGSSGNHSGLPNTYNGTLTTIDPDDNDIVWNTLSNRWEVTFNVSGFSGFFLKTQSTVLPNKLISFEAALQYTKAILKWKIVQGDKNTTIYIEKSNDALSWKTIGNVDMIGNFGNTFDNSFTDYELFENNYYRLKIIEQDGKYHYSNIENIKLKNENIISFYPNPVLDFIYLQNMSNKKINKIIVTNSLGNIFIEEQNIVRQINISKLNAGIYFLDIVTQNKTQKYKFFKL